MITQANPNFMKRNGAAILFGMITAILVLLLLWQPGFERPLPADQQFINVGGFSYRIANSKKPYYDPAPKPFKKLIIENGQLLSEANSSKVMDIGNGLYYYSEVYGIRFAPINNADPNKSGRAFAVRTYLFVPLQYPAVAFLFFVLALTAQWWQPSRRLLLVVNRYLPPPGEKVDTDNITVADGKPFRDQSVSAVLGDRGRNWGEFDLLERLAEWWGRVDQRYKAALFVTFPVTLLAFSIFTFHYLLNDHSIHSISIHPKEQVFAGRWFAQFVFWLSAYANIPVYQQILAILFHIAAGFTVLRLWGLRSLTCFGAAITVLMITVHPYMLSVYCSTWAPAMFTGAALLAVSGMLIASRPRWMHLPLGILLVCFGLATYQASIGVLAVAFGGYAVLRLSEHKGSLPDLFLNHFRPVYSMGTVALLGGILYIISLRFIEPSDFAFRFIRADEPILAGVLRRAVDVTSVSLRQFATTQPDLGHFVKILLLGVAILAAILLMILIVRNTQGNRLAVFAKCALAAVLFGLLIMGTKAIFFVVDANPYEYRYNLSMTFFTAFCFYVIFTTVSTDRFLLIRSAAAVVSVLCVLCFIRSDLLRQGVLLAGIRHDTAVVVRVLDRMESLPDLDFSKSYALVSHGPAQSLRRDMMSFLGPFDQRGDVPLSNILIAPWAPHEIFKIHGSRIKFKYWTRGDERVARRKLAEELIKKRGSKPWPDPSSVFVDEDMIVINM